MYTLLASYLKQSEFPKLIEEISLCRIYDEYIQEYNSILLSLNTNLDPIKKENEPNNILILALLETFAKYEYLLRIEINQLLKKLIISPCLQQLNNNKSSLDEVIRLFGMKRSAIPFTKDPVLFESDEQILKKLALRLEILSSAGSKGSYKHHLLNLDSRIIDVSINIVKERLGFLNIFLLLNIDIEKNEEKNKFIKEIENIINKKDIKCLRDTFLIYLAISMPINIIISFNKTIEAINDNKILHIKKNIEQKIIYYFNNKRKLNTYINNIELINEIDDKFSRYINSIYFLTNDQKEKKHKEIIFNEKESPKFNKVNFLIK